MNIESRDPWSIMAQLKMLKDEYRAQRSIMAQLKMLKDEYREHREIHYGPV